MSATLYGIRNCDTVKKARAWLDANGVAYDFHDYKVAGIDEARLRRWAGEAGWEKVLNRAGTTFRKLPAADKADLDEDKAVTLMLAHRWDRKTLVLGLVASIPPFGTVVFERWANRTGRLAETEAQTAKD